jgi:hypothetical protein
LPENITEGDIKRAGDSGAKIVGFNVLFSQNNPYNNCQQAK